MASSRRVGPLLRTYRDGIAPARTSGPLGVSDHSDPDIAAYFGDTPGPTGVSDAADPSFSRSSRPRRKFSVLLLDRVRLARFLRSVAYVQATAEMVHTKDTGIGLWFSSTDVETGSEVVKERFVQEALTNLTRQFADASSHGSRSAIEFLQTQESLRMRSAARIRQAFAAAALSNKLTVKTLQQWEASLKTTEYAAGMVLTVASLFVSSTAALLAGVIGFSYDTVTNVIDHRNNAGAFDADFMALVSRDVATESFKSAGKEKAKDLLSGKDLEAIEKLEKNVAHLHEKVAIKRAMMAETSSQHNFGHLTRSIGKNEAKVSSRMRVIGRFRAVTILFAGWDLFEKGKKIREAWHSE